MQFLKADKYKYLLIFGLWIFHGVVEFVRILPSFNIQQSLSNTIIFVMLSFWMALCSISIFFLFRDKFPFTWDEIFSTSKTRDIILSVAGIILLLSTFVWLTYGYASATPESQLDDYIKIVLPILRIATLVSVEVIAVIVLMSKNILSQVNPKWVSRFVIVLSILGMFWGIVLSTGLGIVPSYVGDWSRGLPAVPLFEWHILIASLFLLIAFLLSLDEKASRFAYLDLAICIVIWLGTVFVWNIHPVIPSASMLKPHEPNYEIYPFIDSQTYDQYAQSALVGEGFGDSIPPRSLYISFLTIAHVLVGQDYEMMIRFQTLIFAFFPVLLFIFGRNFFGRPVGISIAILAILRDFTSNLVSPFTGNLSYSKIFMSEIPTAMLLVLFLIMAFRWIKEEFPVFIGFLMGGILGLVMLIRTQASIALPVILLFALIVHPQKISSMIKSALIVVVTIAITVTPWLWRNWQLTGQLIFDSPEFQLINLALRYTRLNGVEPDVMPLPDESYTDYNERLKDMAFEAIQSNPSKAIWGILNTFLNHGVNNILLFPLRHELLEITDFWVPQNAFWEEWTGYPSLLQSLLLLFFTFLFGLGVTTTWFRMGWLGLMPLALNLAYNLWSSLALLSGQRFMVTMDWSIYFYYMIGVFSILSGFIIFFRKGHSLIINWRLNELTWIRRQPTIPQYLFAGSLFLIVGALPPLMEKVFPERYPHLSNAEILSELLTSPALIESTVDAACLQELDEKGLLSYLQGRSLYPRYYMPGDGERFTDAIGYKVVDEGRLVFEFVGQKNDRIILPLETAPDFFPHAADVTLIYGYNTDLWFVYVEQAEEEQFYLSKYFPHSFCK